MAAKNQSRLVTQFELCKQLQKSHNYAGYTSLRRGVFRACSGENKWISPPPCAVSSDGIDDRKSGFG